MFSFPTEQFTEKEQRQIFFRRLFRRVFLEDWLVKLVALAITLALWYGVTGMRTPTTVRLRNITLNLRVSNDMEITNSPVQEVDAFVTGDKRKFDKLNPHDLVISVDLTDIKSGDQSIQLSPDTVSLELPSGIRLDEIQPNKIPVRLEKVEERQVSVKPETEGNLADGYEIYSQTVIPANVRVRGAESLVRSLDSVLTEKINIEDRRESFTARQVGLNISNPNITAIDGIVDVFFVIGEKRSERIVSVSTETESGLKKATITLYGVSSIINNIRPDELKLELLKSESGELVPHVIIPPEVQDKVEIRKLKMAP